MADHSSDKPDGGADLIAAAPRTLSPAARRALAEAQARRAEYLEREAAMPKEIGGRGGHEPGRYGDWEIKGLTSDF
jgi:hypothetical protein